VLLVLLLELLLVGFLVLLELLLVEVPPAAARPPSASAPPASGRSSSAPSGGRSAGPASPPGGRAASCPPASSDASSSASATVPPARPASPCVPPRRVRCRLVERTQLVRQVLPLPHVVLAADPGLLHLGDRPELLPDRLDRDDVAVHQCTHSIFSFASSDKLMFSKWRLGRLPVAERLLEDVQLVLPELLQEVPAVLEPLDQRLEREGCSSSPLLPARRQACGMPRPA
jgi:hypothetical protein